MGDVGAVRGRVGCTQAESGRKESVQGTWPQKSRVGRSILFLVKIKVI